MKRIVNIAKNHDEARRWDIRQANKMTHEERQDAARIIKERVFGANAPDVRSTRRYKKLRLSDLKKP